MTEHNLFYYPYASFTNAQLPLLKVAALYFDKLYILDPFQAISGSQELGGDSGARDAIAEGVKLLEQERILERISPADVLGKYDTEIEAAIRSDLQDQDFIQLCGKSGPRKTWMLSLAKVPENLRSDDALRKLMGDTPNNMVSYLEPYYQEFTEQTRYEEMNAEPYTEHSTFQVGGNRVDYRYREFSLPLGESIMVNHALFAGLQYLEATPLTDDPFHNAALSLKLRRAAQDPAVRQAQADRARQHKIDLLAVATLTDSQLNLPVLSPELPLEEVLEHRHKHDDALRQARDKLGRMARRIEAEPWTEAFARELEHKTIPDIADALDEAGKARDAWLKSQRGRLALQAAGVVVGAVAAVLAIFAAPLTPMALATAGLGLASGAAIPGAEWLLDWRDGKKTVQENGLHYLLSL